ncbi:MAG TPA: AraC family transcriptional regulator [Ruminococcaceae bacterium]|nr:AraC family transcriptional regulator [Oscillospiraceae bacterium]
MPISRKHIMNRLYHQLEQNKYLLGVAAGSGISAKYAAKSGADMILLLNSGRFRQMGLSSLAGFLPFANSNKLVMQFGMREIIPAIKNMPIIFGLCATDPTINLESYIDIIYKSGFSGINNYPSVGFFQGKFAEALQESGISFEDEIRAIHIANTKKIFTVAFVFNKRQAQKMALAGADVICVNLGFTKGGILGPKEALPLKNSATETNEIFQACDEINPKIIKMIYGGPVSTPDDAKFIYDNTSVMGYIGGSTFERIPTEAAIMNSIQKFKCEKQIDNEGKSNKSIYDISLHYNYVKFVQKYISENYMKKLSFSELADIVHVSRTYLSSIFKKETGCTFPEYLTNFRVNKAIRIIKSQSLPLFKVAEIVGYSDYAHFCKDFKKQTGFSPKKYFQLNK